MGKNMDVKTLYQLRDEKVKPHLKQYAPVWLTNEKLIPEDESVQFEIVFEHHLYGWVRRRYKYDGFNNVLYHKGQVQVSTPVELFEEDPYIAPEIANTRNAYGG